MMKRLVEVTFAIKLNAALCFTGFMLLCMAGELLFQVPLVNLGRAFQMLAIAAVCGILQYVFFSGACLKHWTYFARCMTFAAILFAVIAGFAVGFHWFPAGNWISWAIFLGTFAFIFVAILVAFEVLFRVTGYRYTSLLGEKQNQK